MPKDAEEHLSENAWKIRAIDALKFVAVTARMFGEFFREVAALVCIFVPLELWNKQAVPQHSSLIEYAGMGALFCLVTGFAFEYLSLLANRFVKDLGGNNGK